MDSSFPQAQPAVRRGFSLAILPENFGICRLHPRARLPRWIFRSSSFYTATRTRDELSIVAREDLIPERFPCERDWRAIQVVGPLDFALVGVLASLSLPLARAGVSLFAVSSYDTDFLLVRAKSLDKAMAALEAAGHQFQELPPPTAESGEVPAVGDDDLDDQEQGEPEESPVGEPPVEEPPAEQPPRHEPPRQDPPAGEPPAEEPPRRDPPPAGPPVQEPLVAQADPFDLPAAPPLRGEIFSEPRVVPFSLGRFDADDDPAPAPVWTRAAIEPVLAADFAAEPLPRPEAFAQAIAPVSPQPRRVEPALAAADEEEIADEDVADSDEIDATGMFTGAIPQHEVETTEDAFESLGISSAILDTVRSIGFVHPTPIQAAVIPLALERGDLIGLAETGSGKTAAFCLPLAERLTHGKGLRGLILGPTREIALQTKAFLDIFGRDHQLRTALIIGGVKMGPQIEALRRQPDIVVATPGRLCDHLRRGTVRLNQLEELVLDEADHMLDLGFLPQIQEILEALPSSRRTMMFSATMPPPIERLAGRFMNDPYTVDLRPVGSVAAGIEHRLYLVREDDKKRCLVELLQQVPGSTLIFTRRKLHAEFLARQLEATGLPVDRIHSDRSQAQRVQALRGFREGRFRILVATDVAARGIDVPRLQHVINFGTPEGVEDYVHRAGRTARGSAVGIVSTIATWLDKPIIQEIERTLGLTIPRHEAPGVEAYQEIKRRPTVRRRRLL